MNGSVLQFMTELEGLSRHFVGILFAVFFVGAFYAVVHSVLLSRKLEDLKAGYKDRTKPYAARLDPLSYLRLSLREQGSEKLIDMVPGLLVTVGILGTFIGLGLAVADAKDAMSGDSAAAMEALKVLLSKVSFKFQTSAWGILLSLVFSVVVKLPVDHVVEGKMETAARDLMRDYQSLAETLQKAVAAGFAPIGEQLAKQVAGLHAPMGALARSVGELQQVLATETGKLTDATGKIGAAADGMTGAAQNLAGLSGKIDQSLRQVSLTLQEELRAAQRAQSEAAQAQVGLLDRQLTAVKNDLAQASRDSGTALTGSLGRMEKSLSDVSVRQTAVAEGMSANISRALGEMTATVDSLRSGIGETLHASNAIQHNLNGRIERLITVQDEFKETMDRLLGLLEGMQGAAARDALRNAGPNLAHAVRMGASGVPAAAAPRPVAPPPSHAAPAAAEPRPSRPPLSGDPNL
jgi:hypothetical protein